MLSSYKNTLIDIPRNNASFGGLDDLDRFTDKINQQSLDLVRMVRFFHLPLPPLLWVKKGLAMGARAIQTFIRRSLYMYWSLYVSLGELH